jgi:tRNA (Thr-GGU) A37 N-methylase
MRNPITGVFGTRSPQRPNPLGLHRVTLREIDGTPVVDIKIALDDEGT